MIRAIPNLLTLLNLLCGCIAVVLVFNGAYTNASIMIMVAAVLDFADGTAARLLDARSELGKQLDSLADVVSFGVAPAAILYAMMANAAWLSIGNDLNILALPAFLITLFSALRLAIFNIDSRQTDSFRGLPTPANALFIATIPFIHIHAHTGGNLNTMLSLWLGEYTVLLILVLVLCYLLVSNIPLMGLKMKTLKWKPNRFKFIFLTLALAFTVWLGFAASPFILMLFIALSLAEHHAAKLA